MSLRFYMEHAAVTERQPVRRAGEFVVPRGTRLSFRMRVALDPPNVIRGPTAALHVPSDLEGWGRLRLRLEDGPAGYRRADNVEFSQARTVNMARGQRYFVRLDLRDYPFRRNGRVVLRFLCRVQRSSQLVADLGVLAAGPRVPQRVIELNALGRYHVVDDDEYAMELARDRQGRMPFQPGRPVSLPTISFVGMNAGRPDGDTPPPDIAAAQQAMGEVPRVVSVLTDSGRLDRFLAASEIAELDRTFSRIEETIRESLANRQSDEWLRDHVVVTDQLNIFASLLFMFLDADSAPEGTAQRAGELATLGVAELLRFVPVVGEAIDLIEAFTGEDIVTGEQLGTLGSAASFGAAMLGIMPVVGDLAAAALRGVGRTARRGAVRFIDALGEVGENVGRAASRFDTMWGSLDDGARRMLSETLDDIAGASAPALRQALEAVQALRAMLRASIEMASHGIQLASERATAALRNYAPAPGDGAQIARRALAEGRVVRPPVSLDDGIEVHFIRDAQGTARLGICIS